MYQGPVVLKYFRHKTVFHVTILYPVPSDVKCKIGNRAKGNWIALTILHQKLRWCIESNSKRVITTHGNIDIDRVIIIRFHFERFILVNPFN